MQENVKKCKNFLATLIKLASHNSPSPETSKNVKALVQDLLVSCTNQQTNEPTNQQTISVLMDDIELFAKCQSLLSGSCAPTVFKHYRCILGTLKCSIRYLQKPAGLLTAASQLALEQSSYLSD